LNTYNYLNYKDFLRETLKEKKQRLSPKFTYERMAKACGVQKTYLSRVLNGDTGHLNEDQLFLAAEFLGASEDERKYLQLLRVWQKSNNKSHIDELRNEIDEIRNQNEKSEKHLTAEKTPDSSPISHYYLDPNVMLVHIFLAVDRFRKDLKLISHQLNLSEVTLTSILIKLEQMNLIKLEKEGYVLLKESSHLSVDSPLYHPYRFMQRLKTLERVQQLPKENTYNFSAIFSANEETRREIKQKFLLLLESIEQTVNDSPDEDIFQMNFDLFDWSG